MNPTDSGRSFVFNADNKQKEVRGPSNELIGEYFYDGEGRRIKKHTYQGGVLDEVTIFVYSAGKLIAEYSTAPPPQDPTTKWTVTDQLGSPRILVDSLGQVVSRRDFMPFGEEIFPDGAHRTTNLQYNFGDNVRQKFTGYQKDEETQLDFAEARMYQNLHGRFTAVDPLLASGKSANPQTFNRYVYVANNPLMYTDPTGLQMGETIEEDDGPPIWIETRACSQYNFLCKVRNWFGNFFGGDGNSRRRDPLPTSPVGVMQYPEEYMYERRKQSSTVLRGVTPGVSQVTYPLGTPEENQRRAETLSMILPGFEAAWTGYNHSNGNATNGELATSYGMLGISALPGGKGGTEGLKQGFRAFKSSKAFKRAFGKAGKDMDWHHIVEQHKDNIAKFGSDAIHNTLNVIRLPSDIHRKVSAHYSSKQRFTGGKTVREWLKTQSYEDQVKYGMETLKNLGWTP